MEYGEFIQSKNISFAGVGFNPSAINDMLMPFQRDIVSWACQKGRAAIFSDCGTGKTAMQIEWARLVCEHAQCDALIVAPLSVAQQTVREASKFNINGVSYSRNGKSSNITVCNYEMLSKFNASDFGAVVIDESSILKSVDGKTRTEIIDMFSKTDYRLACTATPSPNDFMELGNHSQFLGVMSQTEMLAKFFFHDGGETSKWTLKGHAEDEFWKWVCSWAVMIRKPSDIGHIDENFVMPELKTYHHKIKSHEGADIDAGTLFKMEAVTLDEQRAAKKATVEDRCIKAASMANESN